MSEGHSDIEGGNLVPAGDKPPRAVMDLLKQKDREIAALRDSLRVSEVRRKEILNELSEVARKWT